MYSDPLLNFCLGCDGVPYSGKIYNECGVCASPQNETDWARGRDCTGVCDDGAHFVDDCGACLAYADPLLLEKWNSCVGCDGLPFSGQVLDCDNRCGGQAFVNECDVCVDESVDPDAASRGKDCKGECFGDHELDRCGQCLKVDDEQFDACVGCDNVVNGKRDDCAGICGGHSSTNPCGICASTNDYTLEQWRSLGTDCRGKCVGSDGGTKFEVDDCGSCLATNDTNRNKCEGNNNNNEGNNGDNSDQNGHGHSKSDERVVIISLATTAALIFLVVMAGLGWKYVTTRTISQFEHVSDRDDDEDADAETQIRGQSEAGELAMTGLSSDALTGEPAAFNYGEEDNYR